MLLNKINVLDKGFVALISSSNDGQRLKELQDEFFKAHFQSTFLSIANATILFKCPLFVQLSLSKFGFKIIGIPVTEDKQEAYIPDITEIGSGTREDNIAIADDMYRTTEALLINPKAYQHDGCNRFTAQVITPVNVYTQLIVHGTLEQWLQYISQENLPNALFVYRTAVENLLKAEWKELQQIKSSTANRYANAQKEESR
jgi:hypothetical protein